MDAYQRDRVVAEPGLADPATRRWLAFTRPALQAGARAVFGFPLRAGNVQAPAGMNRARPALARGQTATTMDAHGPGSIRRLPALAGRWALRRVG